MNFRDFPIETHELYQVMELIEKQREAIMNKMVECYEEIRELILNRATQHDAQIRLAQKFQEFDFISSIAMNWGIIHAMERLGIIKQLAPEYLMRGAPFEVPPSMVIIVGTRFKNLDELKLHQYHVIKSIVEHFETADYNKEACEMFKNCCKAVDLDYPILKFLDPEVATANTQLRS